MRLLVQRLIYKVLTIIVSHKITTPFTSRQRTYVPDACVVVSVQKAASASRQLGRVYECVLLRLMEISKDVRAIFYHALTKTTLDSGAADRSTCVVETRCLPTGIAGSPLYSDARKFSDARTELTYTGETVKKGEKRRKRSNEEPCLRLPRHR